MWARWKFARKSYTPLLFDTMKGIYGDLNGDRVYGIPQSNGTLREGTIGLTFCAVGAKSTYSYIDKRVLSTYVFNY